MLNFLSSVLFIGVLYFISFLLGRQLLIWLRPHVLVDLPGSVNLVIQIAFGMLLLSVVEFFVGLIWVSNYVSVSIVVLLLVLVLINWKQSQNPFSSLNNLGKNISKSDNLFFISLFVGVFIYFNAVVANMQWPPAGDVFTHGMYTSVIVFNQKICLSLTPISPDVFVAPFLSLGGLHALSAYLSMLTGALPGEAVFVVGTAIVILIPSLLYSLTYIITRSKTVSLVPFLSIFLIGPGLEQWPLGYYYNGPYPNVFGFLTIILFTIFFTTDNHNHDTAKPERKTLLLFLLLIGILVVYPVLLLFPIFYFVFSKIVQHKNSHNVTRIRDIFASKIVLVSMLIVILVLVMFGLLFVTQNQDILPVIESMIDRLSKVFGRSGYAIKLKIFYTSAIGPATLFAAGIAIFFMVKRCYQKISGFYLVVFVPTILSLVPEFFPALSIFLPNRSLMVCSLLSWVLISVLINHFHKNDNQN